MTVSVAHPKSAKPTHAQALLIRAELAAILESDSFSSSKRCRDFLELVVERALEGDYESLTERFLGVHLFGRAVDYETATDSIVRVRANDVRRRLAQYYSSARGTAGARIDLIAGGYIPEFHWASEEKVEAAAVLEPSKLEPSKPDRADFDGKGLERASPPAGVEGVRGDAKGFRRYGRHWVWGVAAVTVAFMVLVVAVRSRQSNFDRFWRPVLDAPAAPVLSLPTTDTFTLPLVSTSTQLQSEISRGESVSLQSGDLLSYHNWHVSLPVLQATLSVELALGRRGKTPLVRMGTDLSRDELLGHPIIAIGSFSNPWTKQNVSGLRFTFDRGASDQELPRIRDSLDPKRSWSLTQVFPAAQTKDYAIVTRTFDPVTREPFISLAGLHSFGNQMAGEFVAQDSSWNEIASRAPAGWEKMNLQVVLEANIVGTTPSSPRIVDVYFWK
jgi:hypothetical protein